MLRVIHDTITRVLEERSLDRRTCFTAVSARPPDAGNVVIECSDSGVMGEIRRRVSGQLAGATVRVVFTALPEAGGGMPDTMIAAASVVDVRRDPAHAAELVTQLVFGDLVAPLKEEGDWTLVRLDDGYIGWVRSWHLKGLSRDDHAAFDGAARYRVRGSVAVILGEPSENSLPVSDAVLGTPLVAEPCSRRGWRRVTLPDGGTGFIRARDLERRPPRSTPGGGSQSRLRRSLADTARRLLGIPYVWGGTTPKGFDCSGFTQRVYRLHGILIPRDSDMQARFGRVVGPPDTDALRDGDLLFFGKRADRITHVALSLSNGLFIHARGHVRLNSILPTDSLFDERLAGDWQLLGDPLSA